ncbi:MULTISPECIES: N(4)-(beta-N-acetylglucosaminyl)-L-asparaginase [Enterococcus]|uniref:N(4)-(beta-N-acetylglucosaminyl)-L-asparaginase n=1 Tax=Enterococcus TaxID=1350 RepID=UPI0010FF6E32|nr:MULTISPECIES: N(4)-(beta-N-acetylglucosaminyl)-L-asparaginase [Enterococcus]MBO6418718.1 N(4)-(beta-N-acetylglucosaminyl)-L-asparaginase [Enterococcus gallinarum]MBO6421461.1 N(4)-(beta-N-acetylglucosaminyl)-L-asparaginase [Enterococcus gallinarum]QCT90820.1 N(4)-(beta-N-acetylglucosaminyl)-L-asparaginase [Enterococcus sp. M190262]GMG57837.1 N(4)-(beta-N-acetylglucosaminyl)-L-asparaginase [Enterococcus gallinarum]
MWGMIATWRMAHDGVLAAKELLEGQASCKDAVETAIKAVEDYPFYKSVGYGGLPNERGIVEMDAAFMDGKTFKIGAVAGITDVANPISVARQLSDEKFNSFRVGQGATEYAMLAGFERKNMLTDRAKKIWEKRLAEIAASNLDPYDGHDTVGVVALDTQQQMAVGTSSSGLFMKKQGRVGDSPLSGSGFYVDSTIGGAAATGLGEDLMKGCLSYEIVRLMGEGLSPQAACDRAVYGFEERLRKRYGKAGAFSLIALDKNGAWGVATNVEFTFSVATADQEAAIYMANPGPDQTTVITPITQEWLDAYEARIKAPV